MKNLLFLVTALLLLAPLSANAGFTCNGKNIGGFSKCDVKRYCGEPVMKDSYLKSGKLNGSNTSDDVVWSQVQQWFYVRGYERISYSVEFENGMVVRVIKGEQAP